MGKPYVIYGEDLSRFLRLRKRLPLVFVSAIVLLVLLGFLFGKSVPWIPFPVAVAILFVFEIWYFVLFRRISCPTCRSLIRISQVFLRASTQPNFWDQIYLNELRNMKDDQFSCPGCGHLIRVEWDEKPPKAVFPFFLFGKRPRK